MKDKVTIEERIKETPPFQIVDAIASVSIKQLENLSRIASNRLHQLKKGGK